jgi:uncharacterized SAM-binding protein YcdF (DUF218 family)
VDHAGKFYANNEVDKVIVSGISGGNPKGGSQGAKVYRNTGITLAEAAARRLVKEHGLRDKDILREEVGYNSFNTLKHIFLEIVVPRKYRRLHIVTSDFHGPRTTLMEYGRMAMLQEVGLLVGRYDITRSFSTIDPDQENRFWELLAWELKSFKDSTQEELESLVENALKR